MNLGFGFAGLVRKAFFIIAFRFMGVRTTTGLSWLEWATKRGAGLGVASVEAGLGFTGGQHRFFFLFVLVRTCELSHSEFVSHSISFFHDIYKTSFRTTNFIHTSYITSASLGDTRNLSGHFPRMSWVRVMPCTVTASAAFDGWGGTDWGGM